MLPPGRRSGKTELIGKRKVVMRALSAHIKSSPFFRPYVDPRFGIGAPTRDQARRIYWSDIKRLIPKKFLYKKPNETHMSIELMNGAEIHVFGMDRPERVEGTPWDHFMLDEYGNMHEETWPEHVRPALSDRQGSCDFVGVPEGRNHYYDLWRHAKAEQEDGNPDWAGFHWKSADILPAEEIEAAKRELDELTFKQEFEGSFINFTGQAYYNFQAETHCRKLEYDKKRPIAFCFDFNVEPGVAAVVQEQSLPNSLVGTGVIGEVYIPRNSNTVLVTRRLCNDWNDHEGQIFIYGDASGAARGSSKVKGSDWQLVKEVLRSHFGAERIFTRISSHNPPERARVNSVNSRLLSISGDVRMMVDPTRAPHVVKDLEGTVVVKGGSGEIDKKSNPKLSHLSDSLGYYIFKEFPVKKRYVSSGKTHW